MVTACAGLRLSRCNSKSGCEGIAWVTADPSLEPTDKSLSAVSSAVAAAWTGLLVAMLAAGEVAMWLVDADLMCQLADAKSVCVLQDAASVCCWCLSRSALMMDDLPTPEGPITADSLPLRASASSGRPWPVATLTARAS